MKSKQPKPTTEEARFAYAGLDRVIHERARLSVLTALLTQPKGQTFNELKQLCALTDGNLARHLEVLEKENLVQISKGQDGNRPQTLCRITASGKARYLEYLSTLEQVLRDAATNKKANGSESRLDRLKPVKA